LYSLIFIIRKTGQKAPGSYSRKTRWLGTNLDYAPIARFPQAIREPPQTGVICGVSLGSRFPQESRICAFDHQLGFAKNRILSLLVRKLGFAKPMTKAKS
jgi:hypothetical protein